MSAKEDAQTPAPVNTSTSRRADGAWYAWLPWLGAVAGVAAAGFVLLSPAFMPSLTRFECRVTNAAGHSFVLGGPTSELALERATAMAGAADPTVEAARNRLRVRTAELRRSPEGPLSQLSPAAECAALLRARAELTRALAGPLAPNVASDMPEGAPLSNELAEADSRVERAALVGDPSALRGALLQAEAAEARWLLAIQPEPRRRFGVWLARELDRGTQFTIAADDLEALQTAYQRDLIRQWLPQFTLELESGALGTLASMPSPGTISSVRARVPVWALGVAAGALIGWLLGLLIRSALRVVARAEGTKRRTGAAPLAAAQTSGSAVAAESYLALPFSPIGAPVASPTVAAAAPIARSGAHAGTGAASAYGPLKSPEHASARFRPAAFADQVPAAVPSASAGRSTPNSTHRGHGTRAVAPGPLLAAAVGDAWLHLVCAEDAARVARAAGELAVPLLARGQRVLLIEAGQRLKLHESFGCAPRWGVGECLSGELPLLGTVQRARVRDLYLLTAGSYSGRGSYAELGNLLDEARRHFSSVVVALDSRVPAEARLLAERRHAEAWWPHRHGRLPRTAMTFGKHIGIPLTPFGLAPKSQAWLEALETRVEALRAVLNPPRPAPLEPLPGEISPHRRQVSAARPTTPRDTSSVPSARASASALADDPNNPTVNRRVNEEERSRERLRFLLWMRQVRAERSKRQMTPVS